MLSPREKYKYAPCGMVTGDRQTIAFATARKTLWTYRMDSMEVEV